MAIAIVNVGAVVTNNWTAAPSGTTLANVQRDIANPDNIWVESGGVTRQDYTLLDDGSIPAGAMVTSITINARNNYVTDGVHFPVGRATIDGITQGLGTSFSNVAASSDVLFNSATNPNTGLAWTRASVFSTVFGFINNSGTGGTSKNRVYQFFIVVVYTVPDPYWRHDDDSTGFNLESWLQSASQPLTFGGDWISTGTTAPVKSWWCYTAYGWSAYQVSSPGTGWVACVGPSTDDGWYTSPEGFGGSILIVNNGRPKNPRTWANIATWAASGRSMLGGSPAASCIFDNHVLYPTSVYVVGTDYPPIRVFDGSFDRELCKLPATAAGAVPKAVMSMLAANNKIYVSSFDSGTTSADWRGRVFELDLESGVLTTLGLQFAAGEMPYALCWHMGRLWCGTNNGIGTVGKVYYFRPGIDTTWTLDYSLSTSSVGGVDSLCSYGGKLYVGSDNAAASFAKILVRDTAGAYTTSDTGVGGTARINNGFLAMCVMGSNLYASYWNADTTAIAKIRKFDGTTWTTAYTGASTTLRPFILLFVDNSELFAVGGGSSLTGAILATPDGTTWTDLTAQLFEATKTLLPIYGVEIL